MRKINDEFMEYRGTSSYWEGFPHGHYYTDGVKAMADKHACYWIVDKILASQAENKYKCHGFQVWKVTAKDHKAEIVTTDGNDNEIARMSIDYTTLPDCEIELWYTREEKILLLPSEY